MAIALKKKVTDDAVTQAEQALESFADQIGDMSEAVKAAKKLVGQYDELVKKAKAQLEVLGVAPDDELTVSGSKHTISISACSQVREVTDKPKLFELLGAKAFIDLAKIGLADIDKYVDPIDALQVVEKRFSTTRTLTVTG